MWFSPNRLTGPTGPIWSRSRDVRPRVICCLLSCDSPRGEQRRSQESKAVCHCGISTLKNVYQKSPLGGGDDVGGGDDNDGGGGGRGRGGGGGGEEKKRKYQPLFWGQRGKKYWCYYLHRLRDSESPMRDFFVLFNQFIKLLKKKIRKKKDVFKCLQKKLHKY